MKKILLTICMAGSSFLAFSQFTPNNLVVLRAGDGTTSTGIPVSLLEYNKTDAGQTSPVTTINVPSSTNVNEPEKFVLHNRNTGNIDGALSLSPNGEYLTFAGYNAIVGHSGPASVTTNPATEGNIQRSVAIVNAAGSVTLKNIFVPGAVAIRTAVALDTNLWVAGGNSFTVRWLNLNNPVANTQVAPVNPYSGNNLHIFKGKIYCSNSSTSGTSVTGLYVIDSLYNTAKSATKLNLPGEGSAPNGFVLFDTNNDGNPDLLYLADESVGLQKFSFDGTNWSARGVYAVPAGSSSKLLRGLAGYYNEENNTYVVYGNTNTSVIEFVDNAVPAAPMEISSRILVASAGTNYVFRGISFTPGSTILPVKLTSFNSKKVGNHVQLRWTTASEKGNSHFEILRSGTGKEFNNIGRVKGAGDSNQEIKYAYTDYNPLNGVNYYKLKQVDLNGESEESFVISETFHLGEATFSVVVKENTIELLAYSGKLSEAEISITDISGKTIQNINVPLIIGNNSLEIPVINLQRRVYIATLSSDGQVKRIKFIK